MSTDWVHQAENNFTENKDIALIVYEEVDLIEQHFASLTFFHRCDVRRKKNGRDGAKVHGHENCLEEPKASYNPFEMRRIDTCANHTQVICAGL